MNYIINQKHAGMKKSSFYPSVLLRMVLILLVSLPLGSFAQGYKLKGKVLDETGMPIPGVNILIKESGTGVATDVDGLFEIQVMPAQTLIFSYVGYVKQEIKVSGQNDLTVRMNPDAELLEEVVVIGYGTQKKKDLTGSVASVRVEQMEKVPATDAGAALQGMAAGVTVNEMTGAPGAAPSILIRGLTSYGQDREGNNTPLYVIDGMPGGDMSYLNPSDIASIDVLKDAAAAAIYGSRAAAGVILITTKRGAKQKPVIEFNAFYGIDELTKKLDVCNSEEYIRVNKLAHKNAGTSADMLPKYIAAYEKDPSRFADTDWQDAYYRTGATQKYDIRFAGGMDWINFSFSGYYSKTKGIMVGTDAEKYGIRINSDIDVSKRIKVGQSFNYGKATDRPEENSGFPGMFQTTNIQPLIPVYDPANEGGFGGAVAGLNMTDAANPVGTNLLKDTRNSRQNFDLSVYGQYKFADWLNYKFQYGRKLTFGYYYSFIPTYYMGANSKNTQAYLGEERDEAQNELIENTLNFNKSFGRHAISAVLGFTQEEYKYRQLGGEVKTFENNEMTSPGHGQTDDNVYGLPDHWAMRSWLGRVTYNYADRYLVMASFRRDGSSKFSKGNKWGNFPSASLGWRLINEPFMEKMKELGFSDIKLRFSYGVLGNQSIGTYKYIQSLSYNTNNLNYVFGGNRYLGYASTVLPSFGIKWESTETKDVGFDLGLFSNKITLMADYYWKNTKDMLTYKPISASTGVGTEPIVNDGKMKTTGWEINLTYREYEKEIKYTVDLNLSHYKSVLQRMGDPGYEEWYGPSKTYVGGEIGEFWIYQTDGLFRNQQEVDEWNSAHGYTNQAGIWVPLQPSAKPGDVRFIDVNGDGLLDNSDRVHIGSGTPKVMLGLNLTANWKNIDLAANFYGEFGAKRFNYMEYQLTRMDGNFNYGKKALDSWTEENPNTDVPRAVIGDPNKNTRLSTRYLEKGSYFRLNNLQIGYTIPQHLCDRVGIKKCRLYAGGKRLFTITNYSGYDPGMAGGESTKRGVDYALYPLSRTWVFGIQLSL